MNKIPLFKESGFLIIKVMKKKSGETQKLAEFVAFTNTLLISQEFNPKSTRKNRKKNSQEEKSLKISCARKN